MEIKFKRLDKKNISRGAQENNPTIRFTAYESNSIHFVSSSSTEYR